MIQEPQQLLSVPVNVNLLDSKHQKTFGLATISTTDQGLISTTLQGGGIFLYNKETKMCLHSLSVGPDVHFACPAAILRSNDKENEKHGNGIMFASVKNYTVKSRGSEICAWALDQDHWSLKNALAVKKMEEGISCLSALGENCILVGHESGSLSLLSPDLSQTWSASKTPVGIKDKSEIIWSRVSVDEGKGWIWWSVISSPEKKHRVLVVSLAKDETVPGHVRVDSFVSFHAGSMTHGNVSSASILGRQISLTFSNGISQTWHLKGYNKVSEPTSLDLSFLGLDDKSMSTQILKNNYIAVLGKEKKKSDHLNSLKLFVLDNRFATIQQDQDLVVEGLSGSHVNSNMSLSPDGEEILICIHTDSKTSYATNFFFSGVDCPRMSLKMALGKSSKKGHFLATTAGNLTGPFGMVSLPPVGGLPDQDSKVEWKKSLIHGNKSESAFIARLLASKSEGEFEVILKEWVMIKTETISKEVSLTSLPPITLSHSVLVQLNDKIFGSPATFWPRNAIKYLLQSKLCNVFSCSSDIVKAILQRKDIDCLLLAIDVLQDISEADWVDILSFALICTDIHDLNASFEHFGKLTYLSANGTDSSDRNSTTESIITKGQEYLVYRALNCPRNDPCFIAALRKLSIKEVEILLKWIEGILVPKSSKKRMWWVWSQSESGLSAEDYEREMNRFTTAIEALSFVTDSHKINIIMASDLADIIEHIHIHLQDENEFFESFQSKVFGLLRPFAESKQSRTTRQNHDQKSRRWRRMVKEIQDDCGPYSIEVFKV